MSSHPREPYRIPTALRNLQLVDLLELTGTTTASAAQIGLSQSSVSRRYLALADDLGLQRLPDDPIGKRYGHTPWLQVPPPEDAPVAMPYRLLPFANGWLACRLEPQVLRLAASLCER